MARPSPTVTSMDVGHFSSKTKGPGEKATPRNHPVISSLRKFRLRKWPISSADFPLTPMEGTDTILALFRRRILGQHSPCSPGPFVLPFESKLLPAVLLLWRIDFPKITVTVTVLKFFFRINFYDFHYRYRLGVRSHPFISIDSQLPSWKSFELISI